MTATLEQALPVLEAVREEDAAKPALAGGLSRKQVVGHLIDSASNNHQRFVRAVLAGGLEWPGYDQNGCVSIQAYDQASWAMLLEIWSAMNRLLSHVLQYLPAEAAGVVCRIGNNQPMPLRELAQDYVAHLRDHLSRLKLVARDGYPQHSTLFSIPLTNVYLDPKNCGHRACGFVRPRFHRQQVPPG